MFGFWRRNVAVVVPAVALVLLASPRFASAGEMDNAIREATAKSIPGAKSVDDAGAIDQTGAIDEASKRVWLADYHPETDRWTERNNRVKISLLLGALFFSAEQRVNHDWFTGLRVAWEVPGFISIRLDALANPISRISTRSVNNPRGGNQAAYDTERNVNGFFVLNTLSVGIFNPELSFAPNLAMWAGFGVDVISYHYAGRIGGFTASFVDYNFGGNFFFDLQYKISDILHVGFGFREHFLYTPQTERGNFVRYEVNPAAPAPNAALGTPPFGSPHSRRDDSFLPVPISVITEININISVLF